jgi:hypothetical protein
MNFIKKVFQLLILLSLACCKNFPNFFNAKNSSATISRFYTKNLLNAELRAFNDADVQSEWHKFELAEMKLVKPVWLIKAAKIATDKELILMKNNQAQERLIEAKNVEKKLSDLSFSFAFSKVYQENISPWKSSRPADCGNSNLLVGQRYASHLCDLNGSVMMKLDF